MKHLDKLIMKYLLIGVVAVIFILNWQHIFDWLKALFATASPIILGFVFAYVLNLLMRKFEKIWFPKSQKKWVQNLRRPMSIVFSFVTVISAISLLIVIILPQLHQAATQFVSAVPTFTATVQKWFTENQQILPKFQESLAAFNIDWNSIQQDVVNFIRNTATNFINSMINIITIFASNIVNLVMSVMLSVYVLVYKEKLQEQFKRVLCAYLPKHIAEKMLYVLKVTDESFSHFIVGFVTEGVFLGFFVTIVLTIFQIPYAGMLGVISGTLALIPIFGAYISGAIGVVVLLAVSPSSVMLYLVLILIIQQIEGNLVYPRIVGNSIGLPGIWVLTSVTIGGGVLGITGMLIGIPITATVYKLLRHDVEQREQLLQVTEQTANEVQ